MSVLPFWTAQGFRPAFPADCPLEWQQLCEECWSHDPDSRPSFESMLERLETLETHTSNWPEPARPCNLVWPEREPESEPEPDRPRGIGPRGPLEPIGQPEPEPGPEPEPEPEPK
jgi:hypothetical protein